MKVQTNVVFSHLVNNNKRFVVEQGGTRSGKSYNIVIWLIHFALQNKGKVITIARKTFPALKGTVYRDFVEVMIKLGMYTEADHNKTDHLYRLNGNLIEFVSVDNAHKIRGRKRHVCFMNEANEFTKEDFFQINIRTSDLVIMDYNPSDEFHWIYEDVVTRDDCNFYKTTYKDNPFLSVEHVQEIERLIETDEWYWKVYGLGERATLRDAIFSNWGECDQIPKDAKLLGYGLDFGFTVDPTALIAVYKMDNELYFNELLYQTGLTNQDITSFIKQEGIKEFIYADSAEPKSIEEIKRGGVRIVGVGKGPDSVRSSIDLLKQYKINITRKSVNLIKEFRMYKWKRDRQEQMMGVPVDMNNHGIDAARYWALDNLQNRARGKYVIG